MSVVKRRDPHAHDSSPRATTHDRYERTIADDLRHTTHTRQRDARCNSSSSSSQYDDSRTLPIDLHPRRVERGDRCSSLRFMGGPPYVAYHREPSGLSLRVKIGRSSLRFMGGPPYATRHRHAIAKRHVVVCRPACTCAWSAATVAAIAGSSATFARSDASALAASPTSARWS